MRVVVSAADGQRDVELRPGDDARIGDLTHLFGRHNEGILPLHVDDHPVDPDSPLHSAGLGSGSVLSLERAIPPVEGMCELRVLAGPGAGSAVTLPPGRFMIGSGSDVDVAYRAQGVAPRHAEIRVEATGGVIVAGADGRPQPIVEAAFLRLGSGLLAFSRAADAARDLRAMPGRRGTVSFNRPPRRLPHRPHTPIAYPEMPRPPSSRARLSIVAFIVPLLFGMAMAILIHPRMAFFALLGPVMMVGNWLEDRRRSRKYRRDSAECLAAGLDQLGRDLDRAAAAELVSRRASYPDVAELRIWPRRSSRMWERRPTHPDFMQLVAGYGRARWHPPLADPAGDVPAEFRALVARRAVLPPTVVPIDLRPGQVAGVAGPRHASLDLVRGAICQAAVLHGPADVQVAVVTDSPADWDWAKWLPHTVADAASGRRLLAASAEERARLVTSLMGTGGGGALGGDSGDGTVTLLVVDVGDLEQPSGMGLRQLLGGTGPPVAGLVIAPTQRELPSTCTMVAEVVAHTASLSRASGDATTVAVAGATADVATVVARSLSRFDDPERREAGAELPSSVALCDLLGGMPTADEVVRGWRLSGHDPKLAATLGVTETGPLIVDIIADGPHGLLAGTTGSGKSELLRTLVASLAIAVDPEHLSFVLIDYKGGSAFDACAGLPHTVGMVTDLDDQLAERALRCLEAELRYREQRLRKAGADDLPAYLAMQPDEPLPRMLIAIDEFAAMAKELPEFMDALVDIAARGRSLGVHLLLATQRPAGVIKDNVRANTNLRMALRVQDRGDSTDVLGDPRAASIGRAQPGRGYIRFGPSELVPFQAALVTGSTGGGAPTQRVAVRDFVFALEPAPFTVAKVGGVASGPTDLERLVAVVAEAGRQANIQPPRRPWPDPLPASVSVGELDSEEVPTRWAVPLGLVDEPEQQQQRTMWWDLENGSLALYGLTGAGTTTTMATIGIGLASRHDPADLHIYIFDFDAGGLAPLAALPHVGAVVSAPERERQVRLLRHLTVELERRKTWGATSGRSAGSSFPEIVVMVDNFAGFTAAYEAGIDAPYKEAMYRLVAEGHGVGMTCIVTGARQNAIPLAVASGIPEKLVFRMADPLAATTFGLRNVPADLEVGRAAHAASGRYLQVALPHPDGIAAAVELIGGDDATEGGPMPIDELPTVVKPPQVMEALQILDEDWFLPVGLGDTELGPVGFPLAPGDHVLIAGEPRSGKSNLLCAIGSMTAAGRTDVAITAIALRRSPLRNLAEATTVVADESMLDEALEAISTRAGRQLVLIDDVDAFEAPPALKLLIADRRPNVHVIAAGRRDLKAQYNHWAKDLCRSRIGVWLKPSPGLDGDLWSTPLPRRIPVGMPVGRGYLVADGRVELVQTVVH